VRIQPGTALPRHTHRGTEMILVLSGGFRDRGQQFLRGDVAISDEAVEHRQLIDEDGGCVCLSVTDAPLRFTGLFGWILNLFARF
jgi:putative transcriptional regulator